VSHLHSVSIRTHEEFALILLLVTLNRHSSDRARERAGGQDVSLRDGAYLICTDSGRACAPQEEVGLT
jgi:hypothetical protein